MPNQTKLPKLETKPLQYSIEAYSDPTYLTRINILYRIFYKGENNVEKKRRRQNPGSETDKDREFIKP